MLATTVSADSSLRGLVVGMRENGRVLVAAQKYSLDGWIVASGYRTIYARTACAHMSTALLTKNKMHDFLLKTRFTGKTLTHRRLV